MRDSPLNEIARLDLLSNLKFSALISFIGLLPFSVLQFTFNSLNLGDVKDLAVLFGFLWILSMAFFTSALPIFKGINAENVSTANRLKYVIMAVFAAFALTIWLAVVIDQLPCFLGVPNCD